MKIIKKLWCKIITNNKTLVKIGDCGYGIRYGFFFHTYLDMMTKNHFWGKRCTYFRDCITTYDEAYQYYTKNDKLKITPVEINVPD